MIVGLATAVSLTIGLEMLPYGAMAGAIVTLRWVWDRGEARRLTAYALSAGRRQRGRLRDLRVERQPGAALRRADPGVAVGAGRRRARCCS